MLSYTDWLNEDFTIKTEDRSFEQIKEQLLLFCIDPTSIFNRDTNNLDLYTKINKTKTLDELTPYLVWVKRGDYVQALTNWFKLFTTEQKKTKFTEDYGVISDTLQKYRKIRSNFRPMPDPETGELKDYSVYKDILQFKNLDAFYDVMSIFEKEQTKAEKLREIKEDVLVVHYTDNLKILVPLTQEASIIYGKGTRWCTAAKNNNMFTDYAEEGPLFILIKGSEKYQFHIESGSYMDAQDKLIEDYKQLFASELNLIDEWRKDNLKTYFNIIEFGKEDIDITEDNYRYIKYLKYNINIKSIDCYYIDQHIVNILDSLECEIIVHLEYENQYKDLNNKRKYFITFKDRCKYYFKDELKIEPEILLNLYYDAIGRYEIIDNKFYIKGDLCLTKKCIKMPPLIIEEVSGNFNCANNKLESLENGPKRVNFGYYCYKNKLKTLKGCSETINDDFYCNNNELESLENGPKQVKKGYFCDKNKLKTLKGCAEIIGQPFNCSHNELESLEYGPKQVGWRYECNHNKLKTLKGCPEIINGDFICSSNQLESLEYGPKQVNGNYFCSNNKIKLQKTENVKIVGTFIN